MQGARIRLEDVEHYFEPQQGRTVQALMKTSLAVEPGEFVAIVGPSGCGKTTLLNLVGGLLEPSEGEILIDLARQGQGHQTWVISSRAIACSAGGRRPETSDFPLRFAASGGPSARKGSRQYWRWSG